MRSSRASVCLNIVGSLLMGLLCSYAFSGDSDRQATASEITTNFIAAFCCYAAASFLSYKVDLRFFTAQIPSWILVASGGSFLCSSYLFLHQVYKYPDTAGNTVIGWPLFFLALAVVALPILATLHLLAFVLRKLLKPEIVKFQDAVIVGKSSHDH